MGKFFSLSGNNSAAGGTRGSRGGDGVAARGGQFRGKTVSAPFCYDHDSNGRFRLRFGSSGRDQMARVNGTILGAYCGLADL